MFEVNREPYLINVFKIYCIMKQFSFRISAIDKWEKFLIVNEILDTEMILAALFQVITVMKQ